MDNTPQNGTANIRAKDRSAVETQIVGRDLNIGGATEVLETAVALADGVTVPIVPGYAAYLYAYNVGASSWYRVSAISGGGLVTASVDEIASGTIMAVAQTVALTLNGKSGIAIQVTGTFVGTLQFEGTVDGTNWQPINGVGAGSVSIAQTTTVPGIFRLTPAGLAQVRVNATAFTTGLAVVSIRASSGTGGTFANQILPTKNTDGTNTQAIKPASTAAVATDQAAVVALHPNSPLPAGTNIVGRVGIDQATPGTSNLVATQSATLGVSATAASGVAVTATLPAAGAGLYHYITGIDMELYAAAARTGGATPVSVTSTNLPGSPAWNFPTAQAIGVVDRFDIPIAAPIKASAANTATTIVAPIATTGIWRINVSYYTAT